MLFNEFAFRLHAARGVVTRIRAEAFGIAEYRVSLGERSRKCSMICCTRMLDGARMSTVPGL
jgi:hypothetical protein